MIAAGIAGIPSIGFASGLLLFTWFSFVTNQALAQTTPFDLELIVKDGDPAEGTTGTLNLGRLTEPSLAVACGTAYFYAESTEPTDFSLTRLGIWHGSESGVGDIIVDGNVLPAFQPMAEECIGVGPTCGQIFNTSNFFYVSPSGDVLPLASREDNLGTRGYFDGTAKTSMSPILTSTDTALPLRSLIGLKTRTGNYLVDQFIGKKPFGEPDGGLTNFVTTLTGGPPPSINEPLTVTDVFGTYWSRSGISFGFNQNADRLFVVELSDGGEAIYFQSLSRDDPLPLERTGEEVLGIPHGAYTSFLNFTSAGNTGDAQINDSRTGFYVARWRNPDAPVSNSNPVRNAIVRFTIDQENVWSQQFIATEYVNPGTDDKWPIVDSTSEFARTAFDNISQVQIAANGDIWFFAIGRQVRDGGIPDRSDERAGLWRKRADNPPELVWRYTTSDAPGSRLPEGPDVPGTPLPDGTFFVGTGSQGYGLDEHSHIVFAGPNGLYAEDSSGMRLVVAKDQQIEVAPGDIRTVSRFIFNREGHIGGVMQSYRQDQLVFLIGFTDGSEAIFRTARTAPDVTVPRGVLLVNSIGDREDTNPGDGLCNTGFQVNCLPECTLRAAIQESNARADKQSIHFDIPANQAPAGIFEIQISSNLPVITDPVTIDASTQPGYQPNAPVVELNAKPIRAINPNAPSWGFDIAAGDSTVKGFWINTVSKNAVFLRDGCCNVIQSNIIGTNSQNDANVGTGEHGIWIKDSAGNTIGGAATENRNVISGNGTAGTSGFGIAIEGELATSNLVQGNYIGTNVAGDESLRNFRGGVLLRDAPGNFIGGSAANTGNVISGNAVNGIQIELAGSRDNLIAGNLIGLSAAAQKALPNRANGIEVAPGAGDSNVIGGLTALPGTGPGNIISGNLKNGILVAGPELRVLGNIVGTNLQSMAGLGNLENGIQIVSESNQVGTGDGQSRNVISGNAQSGILIQSNSAGRGERNGIDANFIGTDVSGTAALPNDTGIIIRDAALNKIGVSRPNVVSGNVSHGIVVSGSQSNSTRIENNYIGTDAAELNLPADFPNPLGNGGNGIRLMGVLNSLVEGNVISANGVTLRESGVLILGSDESGVVSASQGNANNQIVDNVIGGSAAAFGNGLDGVLVVNSSQNLIGPKNQIHFNGQNGINLIRQALGDGNTITNNSVSNNQDLGIDLGFDGVTPNDNLDTDDGANGLQNFPDITRVFGWPLNLVQGRISGKANHRYNVETFLNPDPDIPSGHGEGEFIGKTVQLTTDASGTGNFSAGFFALFATCISATATDDVTGDTSEFSECVPIPPPLQGSVDFGDAPDVYPTLVADNGARHLLGGGLMLGGSVDGELDGQPTLDAAGDDTNGSNDEQGVSFPEPIFEGSSLTRVEVTASEVGFLDAWIDFNRDGGWDDAPDQIFAGEPLAAGLNILNFETPVGAATGKTFARFRGSLAGGLGPDGPALNGEVEDYEVEILQSFGPRRNLLVEVSPANGGTITAPGIGCPNDCSESYPENSVVILSTNAGAGFQFLGWSGDLGGQASPEQITMDTDKMVTAYFGGTGAADTDGDGLSDSDEMGPGGNDPSFDGNSDGIPDYQQDGAASLPTGSGNGYATLEVPAGQSLSNVSASPNPSPGDAPAGAQFPYGFFGFDITGLSVSACTTLTLYLPVNANINNFFKYGPTPDNPVPHWYDFTFAGQTGAGIHQDPQQTRIILHLCDGLRGDSDLAADGKLSDPGGPAVLEVVHSTAENIPTLSFNGLLLLALGIAFFVLFRRAL